MNGWRSISYIVTSWYYYTCITFWYWTHPHISMINKKIQFTYCIIFVHFSCILVTFFRFCYTLSFSSTKRYACSRWILLEYQKYDEWRKSRTKQKFKAPIELFELYVYFCIAPTTVWYTKYKIRIKEEFMDPIRIKKPKKKKK